MEVNMVPGKITRLKVVEPIPAADRLRFTMIERLRQIYHHRRRAEYRRRLAGFKPAPAAGDPRPNFGWLSNPERPAETRIGGGVKLNHLRDEFGEHRADFSVLYLVSSILHLIPYPAELVAWARSNHVPVVWNQNGVAYPSWCGHGYPWFNAPMRELIHQADYVIYQSEFCRASADRYLGPVSAPSEILWNPVDLDHFSPIREPGSDPENRPWRLLAMGTNHAFYRVQSALDCLTALRSRGRDVHLTISGELRWRGASHQVQESLRVRNLTPHVTLRPRFSQDEAPAIYRSADVLLHPKYKDPCPTVPIEAMACGLPVVGSRSGGMTDLIPESAGCLVDVCDDWTADHPADPLGMADAVDTIMQRHTGFSRSARMHAVSNFDKIKWVACHREIFTDLLDRPNRAS
jgi:glycosyltransferase involved in cell wall biosynthesis